MARDLIAEGVIQADQATQSNLSQEMLSFIDVQNKISPEPIFRPEVIEKQLVSLGIDPSTATIDTLSQNASSIRSTLRQRPQTIDPTGQPLTAGFVAPAQPTNKITAEIENKPRDLIAEGIIKPEINTDLLPEFGSIDANNALFGGQFGDDKTGVGSLIRDAAAGLFTLNPKARIQGIKQRFPELRVDMIGEENAIITNPETGGQSVVNSTGLSAADISPIAGQIIASLPVGKAVLGAKTVGQAVLRGVGGESITDAALQAGETLQGGQEAFDPARTSIAGAFGALGGLGGGLIQSLARKNDGIRKIIQSSPDDARVVKYTLNGANKVKSDPLAREALKQGFDEGTVAAVKGSSLADKSKMSRMVDTVEKALRSKRSSALNRPSDIVGESFLERFDSVLKTNRASARQLDSVANSLKGQPVDVTPVSDSFIDSLEEMGIKFNRNDLSLDFSDSDLEKIKPLQNIVKNVVERMAKTKSPDAFDVHRMKRFLDQQLTFGRSKKGLSGTVEFELKGLRRNLDQLLDTNFPEYNQVNTTYSETRDAIDNFQSITGRKTNLNSDNASKKIGTLTRRILGNAQSRSDILDSLQELQDVAIKNGASFEDDIITQAIFVDELDAAFGTQARTSLAGDVEKSVRQAGRLRNSQGVGDLVLDTAASTIERFRGINNDNAIKSLRDLLSN